MFYLFFYVVIFSFVSFSTRYNYEIINFAHSSYANAGRITKERPTFAKKGRAFCFSAGAPVRLPCAVMHYTSGEKEEKLP